MTPLLRKVTIVVEGGDLGGALAKALGATVGIAGMGHVARRDGSVEVYGLAEGGDETARERWVKRCRDTGLAVRRAPWEAEQDEPVR